MNSNAARAAVQQYPIWQQTGPDGQVRTFTSDFFDYTIGPAANGAIGNLAAAATATQQLLFQSDSWFVAQKITYIAILNGVTEPQSDAIFCPVTVFISDTGSGKQLMNAPVPLSQIAGPARQPFIIPGTRMFAPNATTSFVFNNPDSTAWNSILLTLHGRKIYDITKT